MIKYDAFLSGVAERARVPDTDQAGAAARAVLSSVALCIPEQRRAELAAAFPRPRTRGSGDVTTLDIELAERIDAAVRDLGSGG